MKEPIAWNTYIASYLWGTILETTASKYNPTLEVWLINGKKIPIYGNGSQMRDLIYVDDNIDGIIKKN